MSIMVCNEELRTVREGMRDLHKLVDDLDAGTRGKVVVTRHGRMVAVVVSLARYEQLTSQEKSTGRAA